MGSDDLWRRAGEGMARTVTRRLERSLESMANEGDVVEDVVTKKKIGNVVVWTRSDPETSIIWLGRGSSLWLGMAPVPGDEASEGGVMTPLTFAGGLVDEQIADRMAREFLEVTK